MPSLDLTASMNTDNGPYSSAARRHCVAVMKAGGQSFPSTTAEANALVTCDVFYDLKHIIEAIPAGTVINQATWTRSPLAGIGSTTASASACTTSASRSACPEQVRVRCRSPRIGFLTLNIVPISHQR